MSRRRWAGTRRLFGLVLVQLLLASGSQAQVADLPERDTSGAGRLSLPAAVLLTGVYYVGGMAIMERVWYQDRERVPFHFSNDNRAYLQVDKLGHAFGAYAQSYIGYHGLRKTGLSRSEALLYGGGLGLVLQTPIEVMDGIHKGWGFSWGDMAANALGSGLVVGQELLLGGQVVKYKFSYWESPYAPVANGYLGSTTLERLLEDYNGHTYWLSIPIERITGRKGLPRWLNIAIGYGANGMFGELENIQEFDGVRIPDTERYRQLLLSLDIDWTRIDTKSPLLQNLLRGLTFVKLPFPALELTSRGPVRAHGLYY